MIDWLLIWNLAILYGLLTHIRGLRLESESAFTGDYEDSHAKAWLDCVRAHHQDKYTDWFDPIYSTQPMQLEINVSLQK